MSSSRHQLRQRLVDQVQADQPQLSRGDRLGGSSAHRRGETGHVSGAAKNARSGRSCHTRWEIDTFSNLFEEIGPSGGRIDQRPSATAWSGRKVLLDPAPGRRRRRRGSSSCVSARPRCNRPPHRHQGGPPSPAGRPHVVVFDTAFFLARATYAIDREIAEKYEFCYGARGRRIVRPGLQHSDATTFGRSCCASAAWRLGLGGRQRLGGRRWGCRLRRREPAPAITTGLPPRTRAWTSTARRPLQQLRPEG